MTAWHGVCLFFILVSSLLPFCSKSGNSSDLSLTKEHKDEWDYCSRCREVTMVKGKPGRKYTHQGNGEEKIRSLNPHSKSETELSVIRRTYPSDFLSYSKAQIPTVVPRNPHWPLIALFSLLRDLEPLNTSIHNPANKTMSLQASPVLLQGLQLKPLSQLFCAIETSPHRDQST